MFVNLTEDQIRELMTDSKNERIVATLKQALEPKTLKCMVEHLVSCLDTYGWSGMYVAIETVVHMTELPGHVWLNAWTARDGNMHVAETPGYKRRYEEYQKNTQNS